MKLAFASVITLSLCMSAWSQTNIIRNSCGEAGGGLDGSTLVTSVPEWTTANLNVIDYVVGGGPGGSNSWPNPATPGPVNRGRAFFSGWMDPVNTGVQVLDVSRGAAMIDGGTVAYELSGWLGGFLTQDDNATVNVSFEDSAGTPLATATIGPVLALHRGNITGMVFQNTNGFVPTSTRQVTVTLTMTRLTGVYNDGYADNLALVLTPDPFAPTYVSSVEGPTGEGNTGAGQGGPFDILSINNSVGGLFREVDVPVGQPLSMQVTNPFISQGGTYFAVFGFLGNPTLGEAYLLPANTGLMAFAPKLLQPNNPLLFTLTDNIFNTAGLMSSSPATSSLSLPGGLAFPLTVALQAVLLEGSTFTVSNALVLNVQ